MDNSLLIRRHEQESKTQRLELKDDFKEVVERMITFFYTFDYDDSMAGDSAVEDGSARPRDHMQMNAYVYALADKYQVANLKSLALEKFKAGADVTAAAGMISAAKTVFKHFRLPEKDVELKQSMLNLWLLALPDLIAEMDVLSLTTLVAEIPELAAMVFAALSVSMVDQVGGRLQHCPTCGSMGLYTRTEIAKGTTRCSKDCCRTARNGCAWRLVAIPTKD